MPSPDRKAISEGDKEPLAKVQEAVELFAKHYDDDDDFLTSFYPHLELQSASGPTADGVGSRADLHATVTFTYTVQGQHCNRLGNLHGGAQASLFDFVTSMVLTIIGRPGFWSMWGVSRSLSVIYLRPVPKGSKVTITAEIVHAGKRLASLRGDIKSEDGLVMSTCEHTKFNTDAPVAKA